ncbi:hypothetical protein L596_016247 [Steinernema carpocapsae]|uniref:Granulins domain-containing protein n=1 Tax=Steinernema carpocapsae TaxID=34508 RepID=A0A4U5NHJ0_STECR|nr:hypothetical protein L596_016247 [Steinernema carpocapsae]
MYSLYSYFVLIFLAQLYLSLVDASDILNVESRRYATESGQDSKVGTALAVIEEAPTTSTSHLRAKRQWGGFGCCAPIVPPVCCQPMIPPIPIPPPCCMPMIPPPIVSCCGCCMPVCMPMCMRGGCAMGWAWEWEWAWGWAADAAWASGLDARSALLSR